MLPDNDVEHIITSKKNKDGDVVTKVKPGKGYCEGIGTLLKLTNNGNGYTAKFPSHSSVYPDVYLNIDYAQAEYLYLAFKHLLDEGVTTMIEFIKYTSIAVGILWVFFSSLAVLGFLSSISESLKSIEIILNRRDK